MSTTRPLPPPSMPRWRGTDRCSTPRSGSPSPSWLSSGSWCASPTGGSSGRSTRAAARIENEIEEAKRLREEARQLLASYQRRHRDAVKEAEEIVEQAKADAERMAAQAAADLEAEIRRRTELAHAKIARAEAQVIEDVRDMAVDAAVRAAGRLVRERLGRGTGREDRRRRDLGTRPQGPLRVSPPRRGVA